MGAPIVNISVPNNVWFKNAFRFGVASDTSWSFTGKMFLCDLKADPTQTNADLALSSLASPEPTLVVLDAIQRILAFSVKDTLIRNRLQVQPYFYDLIMVDTTTFERDALMQGMITFTQGVTLED
jgi:hypothetical protein